MKLQDIVSKIVCKAIVKSQPMIVDFSKFTIERLPVKQSIWELDFKWIPEKIEDLKAYEAIKKYGKL